MYTALPEAWGDLYANSRSVLLASCEVDNFFLSLCNLTLSLHFLLSATAFLGLGAFILLSLFQTLSFSLYAPYISAFALGFLLFLLLPLQLKAFF